MSSSLQTALSGLRVSQQQIAVISGNVSNVGTEGYSRKILPQSTQVVEGRAIGVQPGTILRNVDLNLTRSLWTQVSAVEYLNVQKTYLERVEQFHGPPDKELSVAADIAQLQDTFSALADSPEDTFLLANTVNQAIDTGEKINDLANLLTTLRNDAQNEIHSTVNSINGLLDQIADLNTQIKSGTNLGRTTANLEDSRDLAVKELTSLIDVTFFQRGDGVLVVQTNEGLELAAETTEDLFFDPRPLAATTSYPGTAQGVFIGNPNENPGAFDITARDPGGKLGGLLELRDVTFPKQTAQIDELAHKMALRFDAQGLRLFTDSSGSIPADTAPDPTTLPDPTPVEYVGFASAIQVNTNIVNDPSILQRGTYGATPEAGSNEVIRRIIEFSFGDASHQEALNTDTTTQVDLLNRGGADLQTWLGLQSSNSIQGVRDLETFVTVGDLITSANGALGAGNDTFRITFSEARTALGPTSIDISMAAADLQPGARAVDQIVAEINAQIAAVPVPAGLNAVASVGLNGEIIVRTSGSYEIDATNPANPMTQSGLNFLGLSENVGSPVAPDDPFFDIQVGTNLSTRIVIEPGDTEVELLTKLDAVPGLAVDTVNFALDGLLRLRPGDDYDNPDFGGDIRITSGTTEVNGATYGSPPALTGTRTGLDDGANVVSALFGTYSGTGGSLIDSTPVSDIGYGSETNGSLTPPIPTEAFRTSLLGPGANIEIKLVGSSNLLDFAQKMINEQTQEIIVLGARSEDEAALRDLLQTQIANESGVNLDEELGNLIVVQTAYSASARVLSVVDELFQELLNVV
jgi:flagellar hook-associated protein 1 FlgK